MPSWAELLLGVFFGFVLSQVATIVHAIVQRKRSVQRHRDALAAEIDLCEKRGRSYLAEGAKAPLYRLPTMAFENCFPALLADDYLSKMAVFALEDFASQVQQINRGLDNAQRELENGNNQQLDKEANRLKLKCDHLVNDHGVDPAGRSYVKRARQALGIEAGS